MQVTAMPEIGRFAPCHSYTAPLPSQCRKLNPPEPKICDFPSASFVEHDIEGSFIVSEKTPEYFGWLKCAPIIHLFYITTYLFPLVSFSFELLETCVRSKTLRITGI